MEHDSIWSRKIRPYVMPPERSVGVDSELDMKFVELLIKEKLAISEVLYSSLLSWEGMPQRTCIDIKLNGGCNPA